MKLKKFDFILIGVALLFVLIITVILGVDKKDLKNNPSEKDSVILLKDYSRFFTIESCIYKYINYLQSKDSSSLVKLLDEDYKNKNNINENNVIEFLGYLEGQNTFITKKVLYEDITDSLIKYYVYGEIIEETLDGFNYNGVDKYYIIIMDTDNQTYSIKPYDGKVFEEVNNG